MSEYEFTFVLDGISLDDDAVQTLTEELDALLSSSHGTVRMTAAGQGADAVTAAMATASRARDLVPGLRVLRLDRDLVGVADIAERTGRTRQNVNQWVHGDRREETPFPPPEGTVGRSLVWLWAEVDEWLREAGLGDGENRPTRAEMADIDFLLRHEARPVHLNLDAGTERADLRRIARRLEKHARTTPRFVEFLLRHPEVRDAQGRYTLVACRPDEDVGALFRRLGGYAHPVVLATAAKGVHAQVLNLGSSAETDPVELEPGTTVRDWLGLIRLYPERSFTVDADGGVGAAPRGRPLEIAGS